MISLPRLSICRDELHEVRLIEQARQWIEEDSANRPEGIHASDLLDPRLAYWRKVKPLPLTDRQVFLFLIGKILHHFVLVVVGENPETLSTSDSGSRQVAGIWFSPDLHDEHGHPIELKTNRSTSEPRDDQLQETYRHYLEQLAVYMALEQKTTGYLWILHINLKAGYSNRTYPEPRCYRVEIPQAHLETIRQEIYVLRDQLEHAFASGSPKHLPLCRSWLCGDFCGWWEHCRPAGRYGLQRKQWAQ